MRTIFALLITTTNNQAKSGLLKVWQSGVLAALLFGLDCKTCSCSPGDVSGDGPSPVMLIPPRSLGFLTGRQTPASYNSPGIT